MYSSLQIDMYGMAVDRTVTPLTSSAIVLRRTTFTPVKFGDAHSFRSLELA